MSALLTAFIDAVGLAAPGLTGWNESKAILRGDQPYTPMPLGNYSPTFLPANEARRATATVLLAFRVAEEAVRNSNHTAASLATVFASSDADMKVSHRICTALAQPQRLVSPTDFHNSVHNAPSGYWHIGARSHHASSAIAAHDYSFVAGLLEAMTQVQVDRQATMLVCYDVPAPEPLLERRPLANAFGVALLLAPTRSPHSLARLTVENLHSSSPLSASSMLLESLRSSNPAGRVLPLIESLARQQDARLVFLRSDDRKMEISLAI
jgi:Beta-ketoacyl synthase, N-terminal domain